MQPTTVPTVLRTPPGPSSWPLVGNLADVRAAGDMAAYMDGLWKKHGDTFRFKLLGKNVVAVVHPEAVKQVLSTHRDRYYRGSVFDSVRTLVGNGLVTLDGDAWKARRALAQPAFHRQSLVKLADIMSRTGARTFDALAARVGDGALEIDIHREMVTVTLDVVLGALLGGDLITSDAVSYESLGVTLQLMTARGNGINLPMWVPTPMNLKFRRILAELDTAMYTLIARARQRTANDGSLLSMLLGAVDADTGKPLGDRELRDEIVTLFFAGHETTALLLTWLFSFLDSRPAVVERMRSEVDTVLGGREPAFEDVPKLPYIRQVVEETLRLRPPAPMSGRNVIKDDEIDGYRVRAGDLIFPFFWGTHRHPAFWSEPDTFDPDRFATARSKDRHSFAFVPFSGGPHTCIGNSFTLTEASILIAQMLARFDIDVQSCADVKPVALATMHPSRPVKAVLRRRARVGA
jgi:cytochrome P450